MIYLTAQPDSFYFLWQLKIQLFNFSRMGVPKENIHVLIGYDKHRGLADYFASFIEENDQAMFYIYADTRKKKHYESSIRPHIIAKHFMLNRWLEGESIFYHDSDIIFTETSAWGNLEKDEVWYASNTQSYTGYQYLLSTIGENGFIDMCHALKVKPETIKSLDSAMGGAQYLLKRITYVFWKRLERNCEVIYQFLNNLNFAQLDEKKHVQSWCTDMWCLWWDAVGQGKKIATPPEMDFDWANTSIKNRKPNNILHYTGNVPLIQTNLFRKNKYSRCPPFFDDFSQIAKDSASMLLVKEIDRFMKTQQKDRLKLEVSFLIPIRIDSEERLENLQIITHYLNYNFDAEIIVMEADERQNVDPSKLPLNIQYHFAYDEEVLFHRTRYVNQLMSLSKEPIVAIYDTDVILPQAQLIKAANLIKNSNVDVCYPYDGTFYSCDELLKAMFKRTYEVQFFERNLGKLYIASKRSFGGCVLLNKRSYFEAGGENENITSWGPDDVERVKRMKTLNKNVERIHGNLYHLPHPRNMNSGYATAERHQYLFNEYLKVCQMDKEVLENYIMTWPWKKKAS